MRLRRAVGAGVLGSAVLAPVASALLVDGAVDRLLAGPRHAPGRTSSGRTWIAATAVLGDGRLVAADDDIDAPAADTSAPRPQIGAVVADSVAPEVAMPVARRLPAVLGRPLAEPLARRLTDALFDVAAARLGIDPRDTEPIRGIRLLEDVPVLLVHGDADRTVPIVDGRRLATAAPPGSPHMVIPGADHSAGHRTAPVEYESRVTAFLLDAFARERGGDQRVPILPDDTPPGTDAGEGADERA